jgi:hypothetical protein
MIPIVDWTQQRMNRTATYVGSLSESESRKMTIPTFPLLTKSYTGERMTVTQRLFHSELLEDDDCCCPLLALRKIPTQY